jgi:hypothetical protein
MRVRAWVITNRLLLPVWIPKELIISITETMKMIKIHRPWIEQIIRQRVVRVRMQEREERNTEENSLAT